MSAFPTFAAGQRITASLLASMLPQTIIKSADQSSTSTTLANVTDLSFAVAAPATYMAWLYLCYTGDTTSDCVINWTFPSGSTIQRYGFGPQAGSTATDATSVFMRRRSGVSNVFGGDSTAGTFILAYEQLLLRTTNSGTAQLQFARNGASGTTTVRSDSFIQYQRVA